MRLFSTGSIFENWLENSSKLSGVRLTDFLLRNVYETIALIIGWKKHDTPVAGCLIIV